MKALAIAILCVAAVTCMVIAWIMNRRHTRDLDRWGVTYGCQRWPEEDNASYRLRLRARIGRSV